MANLDERFLDGPMVGYCSDSDEEETKTNNFPPLDNGSDFPPPSNGGPRTGPKGVLNDYQLHQEELRQSQIDKERLIAQQMKRMYVSPTRHNEDNKDEEDDEEEEDELEKLRQKRLEKIRQMRYGQIQELTDKYQFLNVIESGSEDELIIIHIYRGDLDACKLLNDALLALSSETKDAKFYKIKAALLNTSDNFERNALPTLQIYLHGSIVANFVRITDELPDDFDNKDIYNLIQKRDISLKLKS